MNETEERDVNYVEDIRARNREDVYVRRKDNLYKLLSEKRKKISGNFVSDDSVESFSRNKVKELSLQLKKTKKVEILQSLTRAFSLKDEYIDEFLRVDGALYSLVGCLAGQNGDLQLEAASCIVNLATGQHKTTRRVLKAASAYLIVYLSSSNPPLQELSAWALGNMAGDCSNCTAILQVQCLVPELISLLESPHQTVVMTAAFALANFTRTARAKDCIEVVNEQHLAKLENLLSAPTSPSEITVEIAAVFFHLSTSPEFHDELVQKIVPAVVHKLFCNLTEKPEEIKEITYLLRCIGNCCSGNPTHVGFIVKNCSHLSLCIHSLLKSRYLHLIKEALWTLANIVGCQEGLLVLENPEILPLILHHLDSLGDTSHQSFACIYNMVLCSDTWQQKLLNSEVLSKIFLHLLRPNVEVLKMILAILSIFSRSHSTEIFQLLQSTNRLPSLQSLQSHFDIEIREATTQLLSAFSQNIEDNVLNSFMDVSA